MKVSLLGFFLWIVAAVLLAFKFISAVVPSVTIDIFTIKALCGLEWTNQIPWPTIAQWARVIAQTNLSVLLVVVGLVLIVIGMFQKN